MPRRTGRTDVTVTSYPLSFPVARRDNMRHYLREYHRTIGWGLPMNMTTRVVKQILKKFRFPWISAWGWTAYRKRVIKQILVEFWFPLTFAMAWTAYNVLSLPTGEPVSTVIARFAASFFFGSWAVGHILRVKRHQGMDDSFNTLLKHLVELKSAVGHMTAASHELQETAKDNPELRIVAEDISDLAFSANTSVAAANMAFSQVLMQAPDPRRSEDALFGPANPQRWEVWRALLQRGDDRQALVQLGRRWLPGREDEPDWPLLWQTLLDHDPDKQELIALGRSWLRGREEQPEWPYVWRNLLNHDPNRANLVAIGRAWLEGREDRPDWPFVWRKLLDCDPDSQQLLMMGHAWLAGREGRPGQRVITEKLRGTK